MMLFARSLTFSQQTKTFKEHMLKPKTAYNSDLGVTSAVKAVKNSLLLDLDVALIKAKYYAEEIENVLISQ